MKTSNTGTTFRSATSTRAGKSPGRYHTVTRLNRFGSLFEPLETRTMMSVAPVLHAKAPHKTSTGPTLAVPSALIVTPTTPNSIKLSWTEGTSTATGYKVMRATGDGNFSLLTQITSASTLSYVDGTVSPDTLYKYEVEAYNTTASSSPCAVGSATTPMLAPTGLTANASLGSVVLKWTDNDRTATGYQVLRETDGLHFLPYANVSGAAIATYTDASVTDGKAYAYEVEATKLSAASAVSNSASAITPLKAPSGLATTVNGSSWVHLAWTDNDSAATGYLVLRSTNGTTYTTLATLTTAGANSFDDKTAAAFTTSYYEVEATTAAAKSAASVSASATTPLATPTSLSFVSATASGAKLSWTDSDPNAKGYLILRATGNGTFSQVGSTTSGSAISFTDLTLNSNTQYSYEVEAVNGNSTSAPSSPITLTTPLATPTGLSANASGGSGITLTWTDNDSSATGYMVLRSTNGSSLNFLANASGGSIATYTDTTTVSGHSYAYTVVATAGPEKSSAMAVLASAVTPLNAPTGLNANAAAATSVILTWTDHDTSATGYNILRSTDGTNFSSIAKPTGAALATYTDNSVSSAHTYYYEIQAINTVAVSPMVTSSSVTTPLLAPTALSASVTGSNINLSWTDKDTTATGYIVLRSTDGTTFTQLIQLSGETTDSYADTSVTAGQKYYYQVQAVTSTLNSPVSNTVNATVSTTPSSNTVTILTRNTNELVITSTGASDSVSVTQSGSTLSITADGNTTTQTAPAAGLFIYTRGGADSVNVDQSVTVNTTVETVDTGTDDITTQGTHVTVWDDSSDIYTGDATTVHTISSFAGGTAKTTGASLADPKDSGSTMKVTGSLWGTGPVAGDINQGYTGDCYFMSSLAAFAGQQPQYLQSTAVDMGDGTYIVQFKNGSTPAYVRVNSDIPTDGGGSYVYARPGSTGDLWAPIMEKAYAYFRTGANTYASLNSGWMGDVYAALGVSSNFFIMSSETSTELASALSTALANGKEVTLGTDSSPANLVGDHAYTLISCSTDGGGNTTYVVRNPWGVSGDSLENSQGYATLTFAQMYANFYDGCIAT